jgi:ATP synthase F0 sector subunit B
MGNVVGRTGFHVTHTKSVSERGAILDEMMRELKDESVERWAQRNPSIVVEDEDSNIALVNDGEGGFDPCSDPKQVIAYGNDRIGKLSSPIRDPKLDPVTGKLKGGTTTTSMFVMHLPKSLCKELPDFYPVYEDGKEVGRRSRWVARDREEAKRYFDDVVEYLATHVIPGGADAVLGVDIQFSESTPHIHVLADTFAPDPKHPGQLRTEFSRAYGSHRDVRDSKGRQMSGQAKFRRYHAGLKEWMLDKGWEIEADVDPLRHDKTATKEMYGAMMDKQRALDEHEQELADERSDIEQSNNSLADQWENLDIARAELKQEREQLQKDKQKALETARTQGYAKGLEEGRAQVDALREQARQQLAHARVLVDEAAKQDEPLSLVQSRETFRVATGMLADRLIEKGIRSDVVRNVKEWADRSTKGDNFARFMEAVKRSHDQKVRQRQHLRQNIIASAEQLGSSTPHLDDGYGF